MNIPLLAQAFGKVCGDDETEFDIEIAADMIRYAQEHCDHRWAAWMENRREGLWNEYIFFCGHCGLSRGQEEAQEDEDSG